MNQIQHNVQICNGIQHSVLLRDEIKQKLSGQCTPIWGDISGDIENQTDLIDYIAQILLQYPTLEEYQLSLDNKVDKINGYGLSQNDLTNILKSLYDDAVTKSHTHSNKEVIDGITSADIEKWNNPSTKPSSGWKKEDLSTSVQESLNKADNSYQKVTGVTINPNSISSKYGYFTSVWADYFSFNSSTENYHYLKSNSDGELIFVDENPDGTKTETVISNPYQKQPTVDITDVGFKTSDSELTDAYLKVDDGITIDRDTIKFTDNSYVSVNDDEIQIYGQNGVYIESDNNDICINGGDVNIDKTLFVNEDIYINGESVKDAIDSIPTNYVTTDTAQTITGKKTFNAGSAGNLTTPDIELKNGLLTGGSTATSYTGVMATRKCVDDADNANSVGFYVNKDGTAKFVHKRGDSTINDDSYLIFDATGVKTEYTGKKGTPITAYKPWYILDEHNISTLTNSKLNTTNKTVIGAINELNSIINSFVNVEEVGQ